MKNFYHLSVITLFMGACTLEKEPEIPSGFNNAINPVFLSSEITQDSNAFQATARLTGIGNLNILHHGWVWSESPLPTIQNDSIDLGTLASDSFSAEITDLEWGKIYYLRPFVTTGMGTIYGDEICSFTGVDFEINTDTEIFQGADVQFTSHTPGNSTYSWDFGDGHSSGDASPKHTFDRDTGTVTVRLTVSIGDCSAVKTMTLHIIPDPFKDYWVPVAGGSFTMGCTSEQAPCRYDETPVHPVSVGSFLIGKTEVTQGQWQAVMGDNPSNNKQCGPNCPVESVSWNDVNDLFIPALYRKTGRQHRLPTEAEWEYAARGGANATAITTYSGSDSLGLVGWFDGTSIHEVGKKLPNALGLYDMSGNVWEWVQDDYHNSYNGAPQNGLAWIDTPRAPMRVDRGGNYRNPDWRCRIASRYYLIPNDLGDGLGLRLARSN